jgi:hypothetical protein
MEENRSLVGSAMAHFLVRGEGFYNTATDAEQLIARPHDLQDNATTSETAMAVIVLLKLGGFRVLKGVGKWNSISEHLANIISTPFFLFGNARLSDSAYEHSLHNLARSPEIGIESPMDVVYLHEQNSLFAHQ